MNSTFSGASLRWTGPPLAKSEKQPHAQSPGPADEYRRQNVGYRRLPGPRVSFVEQVWQHAMAADAAGKVPVALVNDAFDGGRGLGFLVETNRSEFPAQYEWQNFQEGQYAFGIEPSTNHVMGKAFAKERGELIWLEHGEERSYTTRFAVLDGAGEIASAEKRIRAIAVQPDDDYPPPSGVFEKIGGRDGRP